MTRTSRIIKATTHQSMTCYVEENKKRCGHFELIEVFKQQHPDLSNCYCTTPQLIGFYYRWGDKTPSECEMWRNRLTKLKEFLRTY